MELESDCLLTIDAELIAVRCLRIKNVFRWLNFPPNGEDFLILNVEQIVNLLQVVCGIELFVELRVQTLQLQVAANDWERAPQELPLIVPHYFWLPLGRAAGWNWSEERFELRSERKKFGLLVIQWGTGVLD